MQTAPRFKHIFDQRAFEVKPFAELGELQELWDPLDYVALREGEDAALAVLAGWAGTGVLAGREGRCV